MSERQENLEKYQKEKLQPEICLENAKLCDDISKLWASSDNEAVFWKKKAVEIREKFYGKNNSQLAPYYDEAAQFFLEMTKHKASLKTCEKSLKIKMKENDDFTELLKTYAIMMSAYVVLEDYQKGIECGERILNDSRLKDESASESLISIILSLAYMYELTKQETEMKKWLEYGRDLAVKTCGENCVLAADMYLEIAYDIIEDKNEKLELMKRALMIYIDNLGMNNDRSTKAFFWIWRNWSNETDEPIKKAIEWLKENLPESYYREIEKWGKNESIRVWF